MTKKTKPVQTELRKSLHLISIGIEGAAAVFAMCPFHTVMFQICNASVSPFFFPESAFKLFNS